MNIPDGEESNLIQKRNNVMYKSVYDYIHNHAMNVANHVTHTSMISPKSRFSFKRENQNEFAKTYCDDVYINRNKQLGITEIPLGKMPLICDVDLQISSTSSHSDKLVHTNARPEIYPDHPNHHTGHLYKCSCQYAVRNPVGEACHTLLNPTHSRTGSMSISPISLWRRRCTS